MSPICPLNPSPQLRPGLSLTPHWTHRLLQGSRLSAGPHLNMPPNGIGRHPHLTSTQEFQRPLGRNLQNPTILHWRSWPFGKAWRNGAPHKKCGLLEVTNFKSSELSNREISQNSKEWNFKGKPLPFYWCVNCMIWHLSYTVQPSNPSVQTSGQAYIISSTSRLSTLEFIKLPHPPVEAFGNTALRPWFWFQRLCNWKPRILDLLALCSVTAGSDIGLLGHKKKKWKHINLNLGGHWILLTKQDKR